MIFFKYNIFCFSYNIFESFKIRLHFAKNKISKKQIEIKNCIKYINKCNQKLQSQNMYNKYQKSQVCNNTSLQQTIASIAK